MFLLYYFFDISQILFAKIYFFINLCKKNEIFFTFYDKIVL